MINIFKEKLNYLKEKYKKGTRIKLHYMEDGYAVPSGTCGVVEFVDDEGQIHMQWDNGRTLPLITGVDSFEIIEKPKDEIELEVSI